MPHPEFLTDDILELCRGRAPTSLLFGNGRDHVHLPDSRQGWLTAALKKAQESDAILERVIVHDFRHTAASLAISAGANVKAIQRMPGHASAAMTLDTFADLFDEDLDAVAAALNMATSSGSSALTRPAPGRWTRLLTAARTQEACPVARVDGFVVQSTATMVIILATSARSFGLPVMRAAPIG